MKEYIMPINDTAKDWDEMFIGVIRKQEELIRCKDCKFSMSGIDKYNERYILCQLHERSYGVIDDGFCSWAERKDNERVDSSR